MAECTYGYPLILGFQNKYLSRAFDFAIQEERSYATLNENLGSGTSLIADKLIPKLRKVILASQKDGSILLEAKFSVASGQLTISGTAETEYTIKTELSLSASGSVITFSMGSKSLKFISRQFSAPIYEKTATSLGLKGEVSIDLKPMRLGRWSLMPQGTPVLRGEGNNTFVGIRVNVIHNNQPFKFPQNQGPQVIPNRFARLPADLVTDGWGYIIDGTLAPVLIREMELRYRSSPEFKENFSAKLIRLNGPREMKVEGKGTYIDTTPDFPPPGDYDFTFKADVYLAVGQQRINAHYEIKEAWHGIIPIPLDKIPNNRGVLDTNLPTSLGSATSELDVLSAISLGGSGNLILVKGKAKTPEVDNALADIVPPSRLYVYKNLPSIVTLKNVPAQSGRRRAQLRAIEPRLKDSTLKVNLIPTELAVSPAKQEKLKIEFQGNGSHKTKLIIPTNDRELTLQAYLIEKAGSITMPKHVKLITRHDGRGAPAVSKEIYIMHTSGAPVQFTLDVEPAIGKISAFPTGSAFPTEVITLEHPQWLPVRLDFEPIGLTHGSPPVKAKLVAKLVDGRRVETSITGIVEQGRKLTWWDYRQFEYFGTIAQVKDFLKWANVADAFGRNKPKPPDPYPNPLPIISWVKHQFINLEQTTTVRYEVNGQQIYEGDVYGTQATILAPNFNGADAWPIIDGPSEQQILARVGCWGETPIDQYETDSRIEHMVWSERKLITAGLEGLRVHPFIGGKLRQAEATLPDFTNISNLYAFGPWLLFARQGYLFVAACPTPEDIEVVSERSFDGERATMEMSLQGHFYCAYDGRIDIYNTQNLPYFSHPDSIDDPANAKHLIGTQGYLVSLGEGVAVFDVRSGIPENVGYYDLGHVLSALTLDNLLVIRTESGEVVVMSLNKGASHIVGHLDGTSLPQYSILSSPNFAVAGPDGVWAVQTENPKVIRIHWLGQYAVDEEAFDYVSQMIDEHIQAK